MRRFIVQPRILHGLPGFRSQPEHPILGRRQANEQTCRHRKGENPVRDAVNINPYGFRNGILRLGWLRIVRSVGGFRSRIAVRRGRAVCIGFGLFLFFLFVFLIRILTGARYERIGHILLQRNQIGAHGGGKRQVELNRVVDRVEDSAAQKVEIAALGVEYRTVVLQYGCPKVHGQGLFRAIGFCTVGHRRFPAV